MCKKSAFIVLYTTFLLLLAATPVRAEGIKVIEFFTSQGCPACPAGDRIFGQIAENNPNVISLGCHVTYFNRRWEDQMSRIFCDARQLGYREGGTSRKVYTPQMIINGKSEVVGNKADAVASTLASANSLQSIALEVKGKYLDIELPGMSLSKPTDIWLFSYDNAQDVRIGGGSNAGKTVSYAHPVSNLIKLLAWNGAPQKLSFPIGNIRGDHFAVIAQHDDYSQIVAAGKASR